MNLRGEDEDLGLEVVEIVLRAEEEELRSVGRHVTAFDDVARVDLRVKFHDADATLVHRVENRVQRLVWCVFEFAVEEMFFVLFFY